MCFSATVVLAEKKLSNVGGFIDFLRSGEGLSSFKGENSANLSGAKSAMKHPVCLYFFYRICEKS